MTERRSGSFDKVRGAGGRDTVPPREPAATAARGEELASQLADHLARLLAHADRLLKEWQEHAVSVRGQLDQEARRAGSVLHDTLEAALADVSATGATALERAIGAHASSARADLEKARAAAADLEGHMRRIGGGARATSFDEIQAQLAELRLRLDGMAAARPAQGGGPGALGTLLLVTANILLLALVAVVFLRTGPAPAVGQGAREVPAGTDEPTPGPDEATGPAGAPGVPVDGAAPGSDANLPPSGPGERTPPRGDGKPPAAGDSKAPVTGDGKAPPAGDGTTGPDTPAGATPPANTPSPQATPSESPSPCAGLRVGRATSTRLVQACLQRLCPRTPPLRVDGTIRARGPEQAVLETCAPEAAPARVVVATMARLARDGTLLRLDRCVPPPPDASGAFAVTVEWLLSCQPTP